MEKKYVNPKEIASFGGYSQVVEVSGHKRLMFIAGQVSMDQDGNVVGEGDYEKQIRQAFKNLGYALSSVGMTLSDVVKLNSYILSIEKGYKAYRKVRGEMMEGISPPASTLVEVTSLASPKFLFEIEAIAVK